MRHEVISGTCQSRTAQEIAPFGCIDSRIPKFPVATPWAMWWKCAELSDGS